MSEATKRPWAVEVHNQPENRTGKRIALVCRSKDFQSGYYVIAAEDAGLRQDQAVADFTLVAAAVNAYNPDRERVPDGDGYVQLARHERDRLVNVVRELKAGVKGVVEITIPAEYRVRAHPSGGPEDLIGSLTISVAKMARRLAELERKEQ